MIQIQQVHESRIAPLVRLIVRTDGVAYFWKLEYLGTDDQVAGFSEDFEGQQTMAASTASAKIFYRKRTYFQRKLKKLGKVRR